MQAQRSGQWTGAQLAGIAVGNGCSGSEVGVCSQDENFSYYRWAYLVQTAFISSSAKAAIASACNWTAADPLPSSSCKEVLTDAAKSIAHVNLYNVYGDCISGLALAPLPSLRMPRTHPQMCLCPEPPLIVLASHAIFTYPQAAVLSPMPPFALPPKSLPSPSHAPPVSREDPMPASTRVRPAPTSTARTCKVHRPPAPCHCSADSILRQPPFTCALPASVGPSAGEAHRSACCDRPTRSAARSQGGLTNKIGRISRATRDRPALAAHHTLWPCLCAEV